MKKAWFVTAILVLSACLVACSDTEETVKPTEEITTEKKTEPVLISVEELLKRMEQAPTELTSFASDTTITTRTLVDGKEEITPMTISTTVTTKPLRIKQLLQIDLREQALGHITIESYMQDGFMYIKHPEIGTWIKSAVPHFDAVAEQTMKQSPIEQTAFIKKQAHLFTVHQTKTEYLLSFEGDQQAVQQILDEQLGTLLKGSTLPITDNETNPYESFQYKIVLDKETLLPVSLEMTTELTKTAIHNGFTKLEMKAVYRDLNTIDAIELPEEAKNAKMISK